MKPFALLLAIVALSACSKPAEQSAAAAAAKDPFLQKLNSLPESERAEYARQHPDEAMRSAGGAPK